MTAKLIVALDVDNLRKAEEIVDLLYPQVKFFKIGSQLFTLYGPEAVRVIKEKGADIFLDLKFHDIPNTVANASRAAARLGVFMFNVHAQGGVTMMQRAKEAACLEADKLGLRRPLIIAVTVLTSRQQDSTIKPLVISFTEDVRAAGLDGVVASANEAQIIRDNFGKDLIIVTPGIRLIKAGIDDQKRVATPEEAVKSGADYVVVGRPVLESPNQKETIKDILRLLR
ncbi:MAG: orotidine-5'-phosphate decarboxylase [Candidatus Omnitrophica bacterium CG11_big_fil_rev_8_21_14_0_20_42_13]|uniref:Orotidine 5'-phosphate decarboxylase n=1 Tax=Candidatus Ghiorseimicrobium undicola TaxID=1974746 RepID=A0A2H0LVV4_9BACT|nr:MAG: orotidine-5'-phosphate decarboxylase [Candidatus Omnitrophica bacterium CG11_big_fil_rev_8_21_14_0_20_42_13]